ncbi:MAG: tRNA uridine-5-carboxymethylaminomethyl(34) synthesis GTPase MnmE [Chthoniobacter sp.]|uniref:tRNA uridine-5-carboxymethylaminomethyl(34) synthesis GTPase MnmE n=1 Tax=Chthoniobacter sp. TaxID=2510640 RepID=UPI0032A8AAB2
MNDTIAAISTPFGEGAIAVLRLSGPRAVEIAGGVFRGKRPVANLAPRTQYLGAVLDGERKLDDVLLTVFRAPHSYTGEEVIEIACHGGVLVTRRILEVLLQHGARSAEPGEFTQRAYLNHKMDLTQAEAVMDLISAQTDLALRAASEQLAGRLGERIRALREALIELLAHVEAYIDFPDEDIDPATGEALLAKLDAARSEIAALLATADRGKVLREGVRTVIYGAPNVGKSSLLNLLLGHERAIVSARPGTTRDVIEETINLRGLPIRLIDTAGVRESDDEIEREGMKRTRQELARADLALHIFDASQPPPLELAGDVTLAVLNKTDLGEHPGWRAIEAVRISCLKGEGIEALAEAIVSRIAGGATAHRDWSLAINARHADCLRRAGGLAAAARDVMTDGLSPEFVAEELRGALEAVGEVVGKADSEEVLGKIFSTFCIGK